MEAFALGAAGGGAGMASAAVGALAAKIFAEQWDRKAMEQRLEVFGIGKQFVKCRLQHQYYSHSLPQCTDDRSSSTVSGETRKTPMFWATCACSVKG